MAVVSVVAPADSVVPFLTVAGCVYVDGDDDGLPDGVANLAGEFVGSAHTFLQGNVFFFGNQELGVVTSELDVFHYFPGNFAVVLVRVLAETSVGRAFATQGINIDDHFRDLTKMMLNVLTILTLCWIKYMMPSTWRAMSYRW